LPPKKGHHMSLSGGGSLAEWAGGKKGKMSTKPERANWIRGQKTNIFFRAGGRLSLRLKGSIRGSSRRRKEGQSGPVGQADERAQQEKNRSLGDAHQQGGGALLKGGDKPRPYRPGGNPSITKARGGVSASSGDKSKSINRRNRGWRGWKNRREKTDRLLR